MKLSKEDISNYFNVALSDDLIKQISILSKNEYSVKNIMNDVFTFLSTYATSTGDLSLKSMKTILNKVYEKYDELSSINNHDSIKQSFFKDNIFPLIYKKYTGKDYSKNISTKEIMNIANMMKTSSKNNQFLTHSFPGAIKEYVKKDGLNIHNELFALELKYLEHFGFNTSYKTGELCLTELSDMSISYAMSCPERILMSFSGLCPEIKKKPTETTYELNSRIINQFEYKNIGKSGLSQAIAYLNKINDFYFQNNNCCIAVIDNHNESNTTSKIDYPYKQINHVIKYSLKNVVSQDKQLENALDKLILLFEYEDPNGIELFDLIRQYLYSKYPDDKEVFDFNNNIDKVIFDRITHFSLNNFYHAYGDGYKVESGMISSNEFSLITFTNPCAYFVDNKKQIQSSNYSV